jgi:hypothetical protein
MLLAESLPLRRFSRRDRIPGNLELAMRRFVIFSVVPAAAAWWLGCAALNVTVLAGLSERTEFLTLPLLFGSMAVGLLASQALRLSGGAKLPPSSPFVIALCVAGFLCMGVQTVANWRVEFGDLSGGATSGESGDRYLNSHGTRVRDLTEEEYQYVQAAKWRQTTAFFVMFSSIVLGMALHAWQVWRTHQTGAKEPPLHTASMGGAPTA